MGPEAIKRETVHGQQMVEEYIAIFNLIVDKLADMSDDERLDYFKTLQARAAQLFDILFNDTTLDSRFVEVEPLRENRSPGRRWLHRIISIADYGELQINGFYEKDDAGEDEHLATGSIEYKPDLTIIPVPNTPSVYIASYIGHQYSRIADLIMSDVPEKNLSALDKFVDLYNEVETLEHLCRGAGFTLSDSYEEY